MTGSVERKLETLGESSPSLKELIGATETEGRLLDFLSLFEGKLCTWNEIPSALWPRSAEPKQSTKTRYLENLRSKLEGKGFIYSLWGWGFFFSEENLEGKEITLSDIGVSLFSQGEDGGRVIPGLSVLTPEIYPNPLIEAEKILKLMNQLVPTSWSEGRVNCFNPYLTSVERKILACLAKGELKSRKELFWATGKTPQAYLDSQYLTSLRKKITGEGLGIFTQMGVGYLLAPKPKPDQPFVYQTKPNHSSELVRRINVLRAEPGSTMLLNPYTERCLRFSIDLLNFLAENPQCWSYQEVWEKVFGGNFDYDKEKNQKSLHRYLVTARKVLKKAAPDENWCLATIRSYPQLILLQAKPGEEVMLPGLYDFSKVSPETRKPLRSLMGKGILKENSTTICPSFIPFQALILLKLAETPQIPVSREGLENHLWGEERFEKALCRLPDHICKLRKRLKKVKAKARIENYKGQGWALVLEDS